MWHKYNPWGDEVSCTISRSIRERSRSQGSLTFCSRGWGYYNFLLFQQYFFTSMVSGKRISTGLLLAYVTDIWGFSWWVDLYIMRSWRGWSKYIVSILINCQLGIVQPLYSVPATRPGQNYWHFLWGTWCYTLPQNILLQRNICSMHPRRTKEYHHVTKIRSST